MEVSLFESADTQTDQLESETDSEFLTRDQTSDQLMGYLYIINTSVVQHFLETHNWWPRSKLMSFLN